jgi:imidazole glycerol-phosphate synthase subunit HisH
MNRVAIVDYGMSNLDSVARAIEECGGSPLLTKAPGDLADASRIILPGVGVFADAMARLRSLGYEDALQEQVRVKAVPFLGICLGMQLMATRGVEGGETRGLGWIEGDCIRLEPAAGDTRIPHVGWNELEHSADAPPALLAGIPNGRDFYFVHSYHLRCARPADVAARTPYCGGFVSIVGGGTLWGVQFHPEKSQQDGFKLLRNFLAV